MNDLNLAAALGPHRKARRRPSRRHYTGRLESLLHERFGLKRLRPGQRAVIDHVMQGQDTLAIMPTGAGKSLCFQLPALLMPNLTVVVSPLISLMQDQVGKLEEAGIQAEQVNSTLNADREETALHNIEQAQTKIVYATPERMADAEFIKRLQQSKVDLFVIDEAHCISQWGHDFRPAYLELVNAVAALGCPPILALTATATAEVADDIGKQLGARGMRVINTGIYRPNFHYGVIQITSDEEKHTEALRLVRETRGSGIIYMATVKAATALYEALKEAGESVALYHGRLPVAERRDNQECFMQGSCRVMVATNAFGMGIDKDDVRFIVHFQMPANLEAYYQESGRAGRDGKQAACTLLFDRKDKRVQQFFLVRHYPDADELRAVHGAVAALNEEGRPATFAAIRRMLPEHHNGSIKVSLQVLRQNGLLGQNRKLAFRAKQDAIGATALNAMADAYAARQQRDAEALEALVDYAQSGRCRWKLLLDYFDDDEPLEKCGQCDNCLHPPELLLAQKDAETEDGSTPEVHKLPDIAIGSAARVPRLGKGRITAVAGDQITLELANGDSRTFLRKYVKLLKQA